MPYAFITQVQQKTSRYNFNDALAFIGLFEKYPNSGLKPVWESEDKGGGSYCQCKNNDEALAKSVQSKNYATMAH